MTDGLTRRAVLYAAALPPIGAACAFALKGDGSDETDALQAMADELSRTGGAYTLPAGRTFRHSRGIVFRGGGFQLDGAGSVIKAIDGAPCDAWHFGFKFTGEDFSVSNLVIDGNRQGRTPRETPCHSFFLDEARNARFENCTARNAVCDGWTLTSQHPHDPSRWCRSITISSCVAENAFRNGLSVINGFDILITGGRYDDSHGTPPQAGIDLEANPGGPEPSMQRVRLVGVSATGNAGYGFLVSPVGRPRGVSLDGLTADGGGRGRKALGFAIYGAGVTVGQVMTRNLPAERRIFRKADD